MSSSAAARAVANDVVLVQMLVHLPPAALLRFERVSRRWRQKIKEEPQLQWILFRQPMGPQCPPLVFKVEEEEHVGLQLKNCNIEINNFVLNKLCWIFTWHPSSARMDNLRNTESKAPGPGTEVHISKLIYNGDDDFRLPRYTPDEALRLKEAQDITIEDFDMFALSNPLSCKDMFLTRPPIQALMLPSPPDGTEYYGTPPYIFSANGITVWDFLTHSWQELLEKSWGDAFKRPVFYMEGKDNIDWYWDDDEEDDEATEFYFYPSERYPFKTVPAMEFFAIEFADIDLDAKRRANDSFPVRKARVGDHPPSSGAPLEFLTEPLFRRTEASTATGSLFGSYPQVFSEHGTPPHAAGMTRAGADSNFGPDEHPLQANSSTLAQTTESNVAKRSFLNDPAEDTLAKCPQAWGLGHTPPTNDRLSGPADADKPDSASKSAVYQAPASVETLFPRHVSFTAPAKLLSQDAHGGTGDMVSTTLGPVDIGDVARHNPVVRFDTKEELQAYFRSKGWNVELPDDEEG